jgi:hypothetical protein
MQEARRHDNQMKPSHRLVDGTRSLRDRVFISQVKRDRDAIFLIGSTSRDPVDPGYRRATLEHVGESAANAARSSQHSDIEC